jgi:putative hydrolase of the HAD superfamily
MGEMYAAKLAPFGLDIDPDWADRAFPAAWEAAKNERAGLIYGTTLDEGFDFWLDVNRRLFRPDQLSPEQLRDFVRDLYDSYAQGAAWRVAPGLADLLTCCRGLDIPVALLSNWDQRLRGLLEDLELADAFDAVIISAEVGLEKPDPRIFAHALSQLGCPAANAVHVGDTWEDDILGAREAGMKALWIAPESAALPAKLDGVAKLADVGALAKRICGAFDPVC